MAPGDPEWDEDRYFNPTQLASFWTSLYQAGRYDEAGDRLKDLLASHQVELSEDSPDFKRLAADGMRYAIAAFQEAERTIVTGRLDEGTLARLARRHGRTPAPAGEPGRPAAAPEPAGRSALPVEAPSSVALTAPPVPAMPGDDEGDLRLPSLQTPLREIYTLFVADKSGTPGSPKRSTMPGKPWSSSRRAALSIRLRTDNRPRFHPVGQDPYTEQ